MFDGYHCCVAREDLNAKIRQQMNLIDVFFVIPSDGESLRWSAFVQVLFVHDEKKDFLRFDLTSVHDKMNLHSMRSTVDEVEGVVAVANTE